MTTEKTQEETSMQEAQKPVVKKTEGEALWDMIKDREMNLFGLRNQLASKYFVFKFADDRNTYLECKVAAAIPALEELVGNAYEILTEDKYTIIKKKGF